MSVNPENFRESDGCRQIRGRRSNLLPQRPRGIESVPITVERYGGWNESGSAASGKFIGAGGAARQTRRGAKVRRLSPDGRGRRCGDEGYRIPAGQPQPATRSPTSSPLLPPKLPPDGLRCFPRLSLRLSPRARAAIQTKQVVRLRQRCDRKRGARHHVPELEASNIAVYSVTENTQLVQRPRVAQLAMRSRPLQWNDCFRPSATALRTGHGNRLKPPFKLRQRGASTSSLDAYNRGQGSLSQP